MQSAGLAYEGGESAAPRAANALGLAYGDGWSPALALLRLARQHVAVSPGAEAGQERRSKGAGAPSAHALVDHVLRCRAGVASQ